MALLHGEGYVDAFGLRVIEWPPLYALWLALWQRCFGVSVLTVNVANAVTAGIAAGLCCALALGRTGGAPAARARAFAIALGLAFATAAFVAGIQSECLMLLGLAATLLLLDRVSCSRSLAGYTRGMVAVAAMASVTLLTRNVALAFLPGFATWIWVAGGQGRLRRSLAVAFVTAVPLVVWWSVRGALDQASAHPFGLGVGPRSGFEDIRVMLLHLSREIAPFPLGLLLLLAIFFALGPLSEMVANRLGLPVARVARRAGVDFVVISLPALWLLFRITCVTDPPGHRFVGFATWLLVPMALGVLRFHRGRWLFTVAMLLLYALPVARTGRQALYGLASGPSALTERGGNVFVAPHATLDGRLREGSVLPDGRTVVSPPCFAWQRERLRRGEGRAPAGPTPAPPRSGKGGRSSRPPSPCPAPTPTRAGNDNCARR